MPPTPDSVRVHISVTSTQRAGEARYEVMKPSAEGPWVVATEEVKAICIQGARLFVDVEDYGPDTRLLHAWVQGTAARGCQRDSSWRQVHYRIGCGFVFGSGKFLKNTSNPDSRLEQMLPVTKADKVILDAQGVWALNPTTDEACSDKPLGGVLTVFERNLRQPEGDPSLALVAEVWGDAPDMLQTKRMSNPTLSAGSSSSTVKPSASHQPPVYVRVRPENGRYRVVGYDNRGHWLLQTDKATEVCLSEAIFLDYIGNVTVQGKPLAVCPRDGSWRPIKYVKGTGFVIPGEGPRGASVVHKADRVRFDQDGVWALNPQAVRRAPVARAANPAGGGDMEEIARGRVVIEVDWSVLTDAWPASSETLPAFQPASGDEEHNREDDDSEDFDEEEGQEDEETEREVNPADLLEMRPRPPSQPVYVRVRPESGSYRIVGYDNQGHWVLQTDRATEVCLSEAIFLDYIGNVTVQGKPIEVCPRDGSWRPIRYIKGTGFVIPGEGPRGASVVHKADRVRFDQDGVWALNPQAVRRAPVARAANPAGGNGELQEVSRGRVVVEVDWSVRAEMWPASSETKPMSSPMSSSSARMPNPDDMHEYETSEAWTAAYDEFEKIPLDERRKPENVVLFRSLMVSPSADFERIGEVGWSSSEYAIMGKNIGLSFARPESEDEAGEASRQLVTSGIQHMLWTELMRLDGEYESGSVSEGLVGCIESWVGRAQDNYEVEINGQSDKITELKQKAIELATSSDSVQERKVELRVFWQKLVDLFSSVASARLLPYETLFFLRCLWGYFEEDEPQHVMSELAPKD